MRYRRNFVPGGSFFFTVVTGNRRPILTRSNSVDVLRDAFRTVRADYPFTMDAVVILPDHLHCIWTLPDGDAEDFDRHLEYIHYNPVRHGHVGAAADWPWSSFHRYVKSRAYPRDWGGGTLDFSGVGRE